MSLSNRRRTTIWLIWMAPSGGAGTRSTVSATDAVQAPVALTSARAVTTGDGRGRSRQPPVSVAIGADAARAGADVGAALGRIDRVSTTRRESSTTQSEYSNAVPNGRFSASPTG